MPPASASSVWLADRVAPLLESIRSPGRLCLKVLTLAVAVSPPGFEEWVAAGQPGRAAGMTEASYRSIRSVDLVQQSRIVRLEAIVSLCLDDPRPVRVRNQCATDDHQVKVAALEHLEEPVDAGGL